MRASQIDMPACMHMNYAAVGAGKTHFAVEDGVAIITSGNGFATIKSLVPIKKVDPEVRIIERDQNILNPVAYDRYSEEMEDLVENKDALKIHTICVDDLDDLRWASLLKGFKVNTSGEPGSGKSRIYNLIKTKSLKNVIIRDVGDWGTEMDFTSQWLQNFTGLCRENRINLIVNAHERYTFTKKTKEDKDPPQLSRIGPSFSGSAYPDDVIGIFDNLFHMTRVVQEGKGVTYFNTMGSSIIRAKSRYTNMFKSVEQNLTWPEVLKRVGFAYQQEVIAAQVQENTQPS